MIGLVNLIKVLVEQHGARAVTRALQEAAQHLHDKGILVSSMATQSTPATFDEGWCISDTENVETAVIQPKEDGNSERCTQMCMK